MRFATGVFVSVLLAYYQDGSVLRYLLCRWLLPLKRDPITYGKLEMTYKERFDDIFSEFVRADVEMGEEEKKHAAIMLLYNIPELAGYWAALAKRKNMLARLRFFYALMPCIDNPQAEMEGNAGF